MWLILQVALGATALAGTEPEGSARPTIGRGAHSQTLPPHIVFDERSFDFGKIKAGDVLRHDFVFTNAGNAVLEIQKVLPGCGCTTTSVREIAVAPGQTGTIPIEFDSRGLNGPVSRPISVFANDPAQSNLVLRVIADVWTAVELQPAIVVFNHSLEEPKRESKVVRIWNHLEEPVNVWIDGWTNRSFEAGLKTVRPGREFAVEITTVPPLGPGTVVLPLKLKTSAVDVPSLTLNICANEQPPILFTPGEVTLPAEPMKVRERRAVMIYNQGREVVVLTNLTLNLSGVECTLNEIRPGRLFSIVLNFPAGFEFPVGRAAEVRVNSSHPRYPVIRIPLKAGLATQLADAYARREARANSSRHQGPGQ